MSECCLELATKNAVTSEMNQATIKVAGMTCEGCSTTVAQTIRSVTGVEGVTVNYAKREAIVGAFSPIPEAEILAALKKAGYSGEFVKSSESPVSVDSSEKQREPGARLNLRPEATTAADDRTLTTSPDARAACTLSVSGMT